MTLAETRELELEPLASIATGLGLRTIRRRVAEAHGNTLLGNLLELDWPVTPEQLGALTVAFARDANLADEIAVASGVSESTVWRRLRSRAGQMLLANAFPEFDQGSEEESEDIDETTPAEAHKAIVKGDKGELVVDLGLISCHAIRDEQSIIRFVSRALARSERAVQGRLRRVHGRTLLQNAFAEWPNSSLTLTLRPDALGGLKSEVALQSPLTLNLLSHLLAKPTEDVRHALESAGPRLRVREALARAWPASISLGPTNMHFEFEGLEQLFEAVGGE